MTQREEFEAWFISTGHEKTALNRHKFYVEGMVEEMWMAWQAAKAQAVPEGWRLVPVEPTHKMFRAGYHELENSESVEKIYKSMLAVAPEQNK